MSAQADRSGAASNAGAGLRRAREQAGIELEAVAAWTRIGQHHLAAIERGDFAALPAPMYGVAFARSYARALGLDDDAVAREVRAEIDRSAAPRPPAHHVPLEDPAKIPSMRLSWGALAVVLALLAGTSGFWRTALAPAADLPAVTADESLVLAPELSPAAQVSPTAESALAPAAAQQEPPPSSAPRLASSPAIQPNSAVRTLSTAQ